MQEFLKRGGRFCLSDDSHGVDQVGLNFHRIPAFLDAAGITTLHYLELSDGFSFVDSRFPHTQIRSVPVDELKKMSCWS